MVTWSFVSWRVALITIYNIAALGKCILPFKPQPFKPQPSKRTFGTQSTCELGTLCTDVSWPRATPLPNDMWFKVHVTAGSFK